MNLRKLTLSMVCIFSLVIGLLSTSAYAISEKKSGNENNLESVHLPDYSTKYGLDPIKEEARVVINQKARSTNPQKVSYIAIFVEFDGMDSVKLDSENAVKAADMVLNKGGMNVSGIGDIPVSSLNDYIKKYSYGKLDVTGSVFPQDSNGKVISYQSPKPRGYFEKYTASNTIGYKNLNEQKARENELLEGAVNEARQSIEENLTPAQMDSNNDGYIDAISFFTEAPKFGDVDNVRWGDLLWSHKSQLRSSVKIHGKSVDAYNLIGTRDPAGIGSEFSYVNSGGNIKLNTATYGVIHHEYFHTLGLPDLYRGQQSGSPVGSFDIMATTNENNPQGITSIMQRDWLKWGNKLDEITSSKDITLKRPQYKDGSEKYAIKIFSPLKDNEYFVVEFYEKPLNQTATVGRADGIIVYRINNDIGSGNINGTTDGKNDYMYIFRPNETGLGHAKGNLSDAVILPIVGNKYGNATIQTGVWDKDSIYFSDGSNSGITLEIKEAKQDEISLSISMPNTQGTGSQDDPYLISEPTDFSLIEGSPRAHFKLMKDIDFNGVPFSSITSLKGSLDGNNKKISNVTITEGNGLFNEIDFGASVKDLTLENINVSHSKDNHVGALAGSLGGKVNNVIVTSGNISNVGNSSDENRGVGGFVGTALDSAIIEDCYTSANATGATSVGGFIGLNQGGTYKNCFANGSVKGQSRQGGFIGHEFVSTFIEPQNCAYDISRTGQTQSQGGKNIKGVTGYQTQQNISLDLAKTNEEAIQLTTIPTLSSVNMSIEVDSTAIARFDQSEQKIIGVSVGKTSVNTYIAVGSHRMPLRSEVEVINSAPSNPITSIMLNTNVKDLNKGEEYTLTASPLPSNATGDKTLTWSSSDPLVATVSQNGVVNAISGGTTLITVKAKNGVTATATIHVHVLATSIEVNKQATTIFKGQTETLSAKILPLDSTESVVWSWKSQDPTIAKVSMNGEVTAIGEGSTNIIVSATLPTKRVLKANIQVTVVLSQFDKLNNQYSLAIKNRGNPDFINGAPISFIDYLDQKLAEAKVIIDKGEVNCTEEELKTMITELDQAMQLFSKVDQLNEIERLMNIDLSIYDSDTTREYIALKLKMQSILDNPIINQNRIDSGLAEMQEMYKKLVKLDVSSLNKVIQESELIQLSDYFDGQVKTHFIKTLSDAKNALSATTNREYKAAEISLKKAMSELLKVKKANQSQINQLTNQIKLLEELLSNNSYSIENERLIKEAIIKAKKALNDSSFTSTDIDNFLLEISSLKNLPVKDKVTDDDKVQTNDNTQIGIIYVTLLISIVGIYASFIKKKKSN